MRPLLVLPLVLHLLAASASSQGTGVAGDPLHVRFTLPFEKALAKAKAEKRLLFLKPIYGGVDREGARDYRCGSW